MQLRDLTKALKYLLHGTKKYIYLIFYNSFCFSHFKYAFRNRLKIKIILLFSLFLLLFIGPTALFGTIYDLTILFQLTFIFIYSTFSNKFLILAK